MELVRTSQVSEAAYTDFIEEWERSGEDMVPFAIARKGRSFAAMQAYWAEAETDAARAAGFVPATLYFLVDESGRVLGAIHLRHELNEKLMRTGGHIGYGVRPTERGKGYATWMLGTMLKMERVQALGRVLVTCDDDNTASARTIEHWGGVLENKVDQEGTLVRRYWIDLQGQQKMKGYLKWTGRELSLRRRILLLLPAGALIVVAIPALFWWAANGLDAALGLGRLEASFWSRGGAVLLALGGLSLALWSIAAQLTTGRGTPVPLMPTQELVVHAPFTYCRNPMTLGTILAYLGAALWVGSWTFLGLALLTGAGLLLYVKLLEERELETRFGKPYKEYKRQTPFLLPRLGKGRQ